VNAELVAGTDDEIDTQRKDDEGRMWSNMTLKKRDGFQLPLAQ
jgi:hypothetical protein